ncbi:hypothetical protein HXX76_000341 [Chlamydomonas incerta]|uniref:Uncharacterized protein n=1 Tax=Chlamydomonas incerta TaxID=51695 RepID=A0A835WE34_CHLIN|nr:hypothetical protein HXX76_000341 [Chlamydomonas incerta]|eukprot:KAG2445735.1 hypothetical protein HXX76_000341 [Chlamydomonas incerta]
MATPGIDLVVRSVNKTFVLNGVDPNASIDELKGLLQKRGAEENLSLPAQKQRLVHRGSVLSGGGLQQAGVRSGDHLVLLVNRGGVAAPSAPDDTTPVPTAATIRTAILAEARRRGVESSIMEEQPRPARQMYGGPGGMPMPMDALAMDVDNQLMQLLAALGGRVAVAPAPGVGGVGGGGGAGHAQMGMPPFGMLPPGMRLFGAPPPHAAGGGAAPHAPPQPAQPPPPPPAPVIPEPDESAAAQLGEMGFGEPVVRKALLLHRNDMEQALNWLLQHGDDPAAAEPLTDDQLRQIYAGGLRGPASEPEQVEQLVAMGFDRGRAAAAMRRYRNMDVALAILLQQQEAAQAAQGEHAAAQAEGQQAGPQEGGQGPQGEQAVARVPAEEEAPPAQGAQVGAGAAAAQAPAAAAGAGGEGHARDGEDAGQAHEDEDDEDDEDDEEHEEEEEDDEDDYDDEDDMTGDGEDEMNLMHMGLMQPGAGARGPGNAGAAAGGAAGAGGPGAAPMDDGGLGAGLAMGGFGAPPFLVAGGGGGGMYGLGGGGGSAPAVTITRGPDGNDLVLGSAGASMPPLMPARGIMLGAGGPAGMGLMGGGGGGGGLNMLVDLAPLLGGGGGGGGGRGGGAGGGGGGGGAGGPEDEELLQGMGLVHQLLSAVLRDALNGQGGQGGAGGGPEGGPARR